MKKLDVVKLAYNYGFRMVLNPGSTQFIES